MPNFTLTPPLTTNPLTTFNPGESVQPLYTMTPPLTTNPLTTFNPTETLKPLYHITPPQGFNVATFYDPRIFTVVEPDQILKNEIRRVSD